MSPSTTLSATAETMSRCSRPVTRYGTPMNSTTAAASTTTSTPALPPLPSSPAHGTAPGALTGRSGLRGRGGRLFRRVPLVEAVDAPLDVEDVLLTREERVALGADLDVELRLGRAGRERVAAGADDLRLDVFRMDLCLHGGRLSQLAATMFTRRRSSRAGRNSTVPATSAKRVWSLPTPTFMPGSTLVPR